MNAAPVTSETGADGMHSSASPAGPAAPAPPRFRGRPLDTTGKRLAFWVFLLSPLAVLALLCVLIAVSIKQPKPDAVGAPKRVPRGGTVAPEGPASHAGEAK